MKTLKKFLYNSRKFGKYIIIMGIEKHLSITGSSTVSWKDAVVQAVSEASKTIDYLSSVRVLDQRAQIDGKKLTQYFVDLDISFIIDRDRD